jgi:hypothetical protein
MEKNEAEIIAECLAKNYNIYVMNAGWLEKGNDFVKLSKYKEALDCYYKALNNVNPEDFLSSFDYHYGSILDSFMETKNTKDVLIRKGLLFAQFLVILISKDTVETLALALSEGKKLGGDLEEKIARIEAKPDIVSSEIALFYTGLVDRISFNCLPDEQRNTFMLALCIGVEKVLPYFPCRNGILAKRQDEYNKIFSEEKEKTVKALFDKLGNSILIATGAPEDSIDVVDTIVMYGILFTACMISFTWIPESLPELLKEQ